MSVSSNWLTAVRLERLAQTLRAVVASPRCEWEDVAKSVWRICGGPYDEVEQILFLLGRLRLIEIQSRSICRSVAGDQVAKDIKRGDLRSLGLALIRSGYFYDQARIIVECGKIDGDRNLICPLRYVRKGAPQLLGVLKWWSEVQVLSGVHIPRSLLEELNTVWALLPPLAEPPAWAAERKEVGNRAEMYTVQYERSRVSDPSHIVWAARDSDSLGWDVEDHSIYPFRCIEVKGRRDEEIIFFLSDNEWVRAKELGQRYEVHFWGKINLASDPSTEYIRLCQAGYPISIKAFASQVENGQWEATAVRWRIRRSNI